ncbi:MAG: hypothetical protein ACLFQB_12875 [Chitinispirillaceae bacterium]
MDTSDALFMIQEQSGSGTGYHRFPPSLTDIMINRFRRGPVKNVSPCRVKI